MVLLVLPLIGAVVALAVLANGLREDLQSVRQQLRFLSIQVDELQTKLAIRQVTTAAIQALDEVTRRSLGQ